MAKGKKVKKPEEVAPSVDIAKDIDEIFASRKVVAKKSKAQKAKPKEVPTQPLLQSIESGLETVTNQVRAAKAKHSSEASPIVKEDDFADIRGTKKRSFTSTFRFLYAGKRTVDGLTMYNEDELKIGQGRDTSLCPFDCDCC
jgi:hypothetical protein